MKLFHQVLLVSGPLLWASSAAADGGFDGYGGFGHMMWGGGFGILGGLMMLAFWGVIIGLIVVAIRWLSDRNTSGKTNPGPRDALEILRERFAQGEIDATEYEARRKVLGD